MGATTEGCCQQAQQRHKQYTEEGRPRRYNTGASLASDVQQQDSKCFNLCVGRPAIYRLLSCVLTLQLELPVYRAGLDTTLLCAKEVFPRK